MKLWLEGKLWIWDEVKDGLRERQAEKEGKKEVRVMEKREGFLLEGEGERARKR